MLINYTHTKEGFLIYDDFRRVYALVKANDHAEFYNTVAAFKSGLPVHNMEMV